MGRVRSLRPERPLPVVRPSTRDRPGARGTAGRRARGLADRRLRGGACGARRPAAVQGHARRAGAQRRGRGGGSARSGAGPAHARRRPARPHPPAPMATPAFTRRRVDRLEERIRAIVHGLLDDLAAREGVVDLVAGYAFPLPFTVICELLGIPEPDRAVLGRWFRTLLAPDPGPDAVAASEAIVGYLTALLDRKRAEPGEDLVTDLVVAARGGALTEQEMLSTIFQLVVA